MKIYGGLYDAVHLLDELKDECMHGRNMDGILTGLELLDMVLGGLHAGDVIAVGGRPGMGATRFLLSIALHATLKEHLSVLVFSPEMPPKLMIENMAALSAGIPVRDIERGSLDDDQKRKLCDMLDQINESEIMIDGTLDLGIKKLKKLCRKHLKDNGIDLILIDRIDLVKDNEKCGSKEIISIGSALKELSMETGAPVIYSAYISRSVDERDDHRPIIPDLTSRVPFAENADAMILLYRKGYYFLSGSEDVLDVHVAHNNNGPSAVVRFMYDARIGSIKSFPPEHL